jgi:hypothetical protein
MIQQEILDFEPRLNFDAPRMLHGNIMFVTCI